MRSLTFWKLEIGRSPKKSALMYVLLVQTFALGAYFVTESLGDLVSKTGTLLLEFTTTHVDGLILRMVIFVTHMCALTEREAFFGPMLLSAICFSYFGSAAVVAALEMYDNERERLENRTAALVGSPAALLALAIFLISSVMFFSGSITTGNVPTIEAAGRIVVVALCLGVILCAAWVLGFTERHDEKRDNSPLLRFFFLLFATGILFIPSSEGTRQNFICATFCEIVFLALLWRGPIPKPTTTVTKS